MTGPVVTCAHVVDLRTSGDDVGYVDPYEIDQACRRANTIANVQPGGTVIVKADKPYPPEDVVRHLREYASVAGRIVVEYYGGDPHGGPAWVRAIEGRR